MPHIEVICRKGFSFRNREFPRGGPEPVERFRECLRDSVARHLSCSDLNGELTKEDVAVSFIWQEMHDVISEDVLIKIMANYFPSRAIDAQDRLRAIVGDMAAYELSKAMRGTTLAFWLLMPTAAFEAVTVS